MNTMIEKSKVMTRAHQIARCIKTYQQPLAKYAYLFREAMRQAWAELREAAMRAIEEAKRIVVPITTSNSYMAGCADYYANARRGQYMGD